MEEISLHRKVVFSTTSGCNEDEEVLRQDNDAWVSKELVDVMPERGKRLLTMNGEMYG